MAGRLGRGASWPSNQPPRKGTRDKPCDKTAAHSPPRNDIYETSLFIFCSIDSTDNIEFCADDDDNNVTAGVQVYFHSP